MACLRSMGSDFNTDRISSLYWRYCLIKSSVCNSELYNLATAKSWAICSLSIIIPTSLRGDYITERRFLICQIYLKWLYQKKNRKKLRSLFQHFFYFRKRTGLFFCQMRTLLRSAEILKKREEDRIAGGVGMDKQDERKLLNTLNNIDSTLKRIEQSLMAEKQHGVIKELCLTPYLERNIILLQKMLNSEIVCLFQILNFFNGHRDISAQRRFSFVKFIFGKF